MAEEAGTVEPAQPIAPGEMVGEGDMDFAEPGPTAKPAAAAVAAAAAPAVMKITTPQGKVQKVVFTNTPQPRSKATAGQAGGCSWARSAARPRATRLLKKAVAKLPAGLAG